MSDLNQYYLSKTEPQKGCLLVLRRLILAQDERISETQKWGMPCFCVLNKPFCYLWIDKQSNNPYLLFVEGNQLDHPALKQGSRKKMKIFLVDPEEDIPVQLVKELLDLALALY